MKCPVQSLVQNQCSMNIISPPLLCMAQAITLIVDQHYKQCYIRRYESIEGCWAKFILSYLTHHCQINLCKIQLFCFSTYSFQRLSTVCKIEPNSLAYFSSSIKLLFLKPFPSFCCCSHTLYSSPTELGLFTLHSLLFSISVVPFPHNISSTLSSLFYYDQDSVAPP